ncbi:asparagine synthase-related protein [bacterium]|nr:asparagine synthase-related protein [bacterium]
MDSVARLNGSFNILIIEETPQRITLISDRYGTRPLFYGCKNNSLAVSDNCQSIIDSGLLQKKLNTRLVANQLSFSRVWIGDDTFFDGVKSLPGASVARWNAANGLAVSSYKSQIKPLFDRRTPGTARDLATVLVEVMTDFKALDNVGLSLSGGLDSRLLLAAGFQGKTFTWGYQPQNDEIEFAQACAKINGNPWEFIHLSPTDFLDSDGLGDNIREGLDMSVQSHSLSVYPKIVDQEIQGLITGLALDFTMAGSYFPPRTKCNTDQELSDFAFNAIEVFEFNKRTQFIRSEEILSQIEGLQEEVACRFGAIKKNSSVFEQIQDFFMDSRVRRWTFQRQKWQRSFLEDYIPTFDNRLIDYLSTFKTDALARHKIFREVLIQLSPELANVPYQRTGLPPSVPIEFWDEGKKLSQQRETLYRRMYAKTKGKVFLPYNQYYSNFDEWLRVDPAWLAATEELLSTPKSRIYEFVNKQVVDNWIEEQRSGQQPHYGKIIQLMSLEKTLRASF